MAIDGRYTLPSGMVVTLAMPDLYQVLATAGRIPAPHIAAVLDLLVKDGAYTPSGPGVDIYVRKAEEIRGRYALAALCLQDPQLVLDDAPGPGQIGPADLAWMDLEAIYFTFFRLGHQGAAIGLPDPAKPGGAADPPPAGGDLPPGPEPASGDKRPARRRRA